MEVDYSGVSNYGRDFAAIVQELLDGMYPKVIILAAEGGIDNLSPLPKNNENLYIRGWYSSEEYDPKKDRSGRGYRDICNPDFGPKNGQIWNYKIDESWRIWKPGGIGVPIIDDAGYVVAEFVDQKRLYIHVPIFDYRFTSGLDIFRLIMLKVKELVLGPIVNWPTLLARIGNFSKINSAVQRQKLIDFTLSQFDQTIASLKKQLFQSRQELSNKEFEAQKLSSQVAARYPLLEKGNQDTGPERAQELLQQLIQVPKVKRVLITEDLDIEIFTDPIAVFDDRSDEWHLLGNFQIIVPFDSEDDLSFNNLTWRRNDIYDAPHVMDGSACYGNTDETFLNLQEEGDILSLVVLAIQFLSHANTDDDWGMYVDEWPLAMPA